MVTSTIRATIQGELSRVWETVLAVEGYTWRSDISRAEVLNRQQFVEYTKQGYATHFTITAIEPCCRLEFDMENPRMKGHWIGLFQANGGNTEICFTETVTVRPSLLNPFVKRYLQRQQARFVSDLQQALSQ